MQVTMRRGSTVGPEIGIACVDLLHGFRAWRLWGKFAKHDMIARYRRSWVGPFWIVLSAAIFIGALSVLYSSLFRTEIRDYLPYVAVGFVAWGFISVVTAESVLTFVEAQTYIRQIRVNLFVYIFRVICRNVFVLAHQFLVVLAVLLIFGKLHLLLLPLAVLGIFLFLLQALWVTPLLGLVGTRFRDLQQITANALQVLFFVTPVIWSPSLLGSRRWIADFNPLNSIIAVVREPLLGNVPPAWDYGMVVVTTVAGLLLGMLIYGRFSRRVVYWL